MQLIPVDLAAAFALSASLFACQTAHSKAILRHSQVADFPQRIRIFDLSGAPSQRMLHAMEGLYSSQSSVVSTWCSFTDNNASVKGGGIFVRNYSDETIRGCTFSRNRAREGGACYLDWKSDARMTNCTIAENSSELGGGGILNKWSNLWLTNCTVSGNSAFPEGGGLFFGFSSKTTLRNSIIWGNHASKDAQLNSHENSQETISHCIIEGGYSDGMNVRDEDPYLHPLYPNGGHVLTMAIPLNSPAVKSGSPEDAPADDARGIMRETSQCG